MGLHVKQRYCRRNHWAQEDECIQHNDRSLDPETNLEIFWHAIEEKCGMRHCLGKPWRAIRYPRLNDWWQRGTLTSLSRSSRHFRVNRHVTRHRSLAKRPQEWGAGRRAKNTLIECYSLDDGIGNLPLKHTRSGGQNTFNDLLRPSCGHHGRFVYPICIDRSCDVILDVLSQGRRALLKALTAWYSSLSTIKHDGYPHILDGHRHVYQLSRTCWGQDEYVDVGPTCLQSISSAAW